MINQERKRNNKRWYKIERKRKKKQVGGRGRGTGREGDARRTAVRFGGGKKMCASSIEGWLLRAVLKSPRGSGKAQRARLDDLGCYLLWAAQCCDCNASRYILLVVLMLLDSRSVHSANLASAMTVSHHAPTLCNWFTKSWTNKVQWFTN